METRQPLSLRTPEPNSVFFSSVLFPAGLIISGTMSKKYNVGVIGYGWAAQAHIDAINGTDQGNVVAVYSSRPLDNLTLSKQHGGEIISYDDGSEMLARSDIDVVSITSYPNQQPRAGKCGGESGKTYYPGKTNGADLGGLLGDLSGSAGERGKSDGVL